MKTLIIFLFLLGLCIGCAGMTPAQREYWDNVAEAMVGFSERQAVSNQMNYQQVQIDNLRLQRQFGPR